MLRTRPERGKEAFERATRPAREGCAGQRDSRNTGAWAASWARSQPFSSVPPP